ncbi:MAG: transcription antitermination protein NusB [Prevotellaceae bacterium]|jgi:N utilization substance protein B|nr:transcription antitermination protein NusB [Prevotellaceae bacterium]
MISRRLLRVKVLKELYGYAVSHNSLPAAEKELALSIDKTYDQYKYLFLFLPMLQDYAQSRIDIGRQKFLPTDIEINPNTKFAENQVIQRIAENSDLRKYAERNSVMLTEASGVVKKMYANIVEREYYKEYMENPTQSFAEDKQLLVDILVNEFEDLEDLEVLLEEQSIYWTDEPGFVVSAIIKTVKSMSATKPFKLLEFFKNPEDEEFASRLFRCSAVKFEEYSKLIDEYTPNWDVERIAFTDTLLLVAAIAELIEFPFIPVKVTMDEYIELARFYSTSGSSTFINGVLDKAVHELTSKGMIEKRGAGLMEK